MKRLTFIKNYFLIIFIFFVSLDILAKECTTKSPLKVGIIKNDYIDYQYYLYFTLGNYSLEEKIEFELSEVNNNIDNFDILFGEYYDLAKLSQNKFIAPDKLKRFYARNKINITNNILPLDLDTFIILSKRKSKNISFEQLTKIEDPFKYTLGMSLYPIQNLIKILTYTTGMEEINVNNNIVEKNLTLLKKIIKNSNKNILYSDYSEIYESYQISENNFTVFSDGILLKKDIEYQHYQLFPKSKYNWDYDLGIYKDRQSLKPISFFGFSAYLNKVNQNGFLCYLINEKVRINSFKEFNIGLSPLSENELEPIKDKISKDYKYILKNKHKFIHLNIDTDIKYENITNLLLGEKKYSEIFENYDYLN